MSPKPKIYWILIVLQTSRFYYFYFTFLISVFLTLQSIVIYVSSMEISVDVSQEKNARSTSYAPPLPGAKGLQVNTSQRPLHIMLPAALCTAAMELA